MEKQRYAPGLFDRLLDDQREAVPATWTLDHLKDAVARDLESLLNTRAAMPEQLFVAYPEASRSVLTYGLTDFADLCMTSDTDRKKICAAVLLTIERHEPRLQGVTATLRQRSSQINRFDFVISGKLKAQAASDMLHFDAVLEPATQRYSIRKT
ncbi:type VI secretion system baseplate subunit TssE [Massilia sp. DWR3-1-1]|uniref:type VI secretion system baseplate subunit TssE n=1 Tax=Massilia sp. DWR3-1-1 TaxID=2804559 RepID=UPI003CFBA44F